jgi:hypothetical protein
MLEEMKRIKKKNNYWLIIKKNIDQILERNEIQLEKMK